MKVVILAGGFGTRIAEANGPKPMVNIGNKPILYHIINYYQKFGYDDFIVALGYKGDYIKKKFKNYKFNIQFIDTGLNTMTGGRIKKLKKYLNNERFMLTYGDGLCNVNLSKLLKHHIASKKIATVTAVHPPARFGEIIIKSNKVTEFNEKIQSKQNWINGGFFVFEPEFLNYIKGDQTSLEAEPLTTISKKGLLAAYKHEKFWQCMDTMKDKNYLEELWKKKAPWK
jgi:glucose-1-phosphate cytidylyltransferase